MTVHAHTSYSEIAKDHARCPRNYGAPSSYNGHARITGPCGDTMEFWIQVVEHTILHIGYTTDGCGSSHACGSMATTLAHQRIFSEVLTMQQQDVLDAMGEFPQASSHCALLAVTTLHAACNDYLEKHRGRF